MKRHKRKTKKIPQWLLHQWQQKCNRGWVMLPALSIELGCGEERWLTWIRSRSCVSDGRVDREAMARRGHDTRRVHQTQILERKKTRPGRVVRIGGTSWALMLESGAWLKGWWTPLWCSAGGTAATTASTMLPGPAEGTTTSSPRWGGTNRKEKVAEEPSPSRPWHRGQPWAVRGYRNVLHASTVPFQGSPIWLARTRPFLNQWWIWDAESGKGDDTGGAWRVGQRLRWARWHRMCAVTALMQELWSTISLTNSLIFTYGNVDQ